MANEVVLTQGNLVANGFYKIIGFLKIDNPLLSLIKLGYFLQYKADGTAVVKTDERGTIPDSPAVIPADVVSILFYKNVPNTMINDYVTARNALLNL